MKENENKAIELSEEELAQVSGGFNPASDPVIIDDDGGGTANDGKCGQTVNLGIDGKCTTPPNSQCKGCRYKPGNSC